MIYEYSKNILNPEKLINTLESSSVGPKFNHIKISNVTGTYKTYIHTTVELSPTELTVLNDLVNNFVDFTTAESLTTYLDETIHPFVKDLINKFTAENMALGITQAGKTAQVLGLFEKRYDVHSNGYPISLKGAFDTGSLYEVLAIISYVRANPIEFDGLSPFITDAKLEAMSNEIIGALS